MAATGDHAHAAWLPGAAHRLRQDTGVALTGPRPFHDAHAATERRVREARGTLARATAWGRGGVGARRTAGPARRALMRGRAAAGPLALHGPGLAVLLCGRPCLLCRGRVVAARFRAGVPAGRYRAAVRRTDPDRCPSGDGRARHLPAPGEGASGYGATAICWAGSVVSATV
ncbi:hypothetical protein [Streptomyces sp. Wb2n-11]|uniref:hypothetical protein n=1 Tax=Streptomyces sp. Wb2n-11 TaxID=1030533 RepID=UPI000B81DBE5|nr:hypothetical protein [Streptomyces sp. Wb2n-11]